MHGLLEAIHSSLVQLFRAKIWLGGVGHWFPLRPRDHFCHTSCPIHCYGHNFNENILTPQNDSFEAILWFCGSQLQKYRELDELITILGWEIFWICQVWFLPFTSKKGFQVGTNFVPRAYVWDYVIFQIWKTLWRKECGAAVPPYIHWVQAHGCARHVLDVLLHCI